MSDIPADIERVTAHFGEVPYSLPELRERVGRAILAERKASVEAVLDALLAHELYKYRPGAFKGFVAYARETLCPEFRGEA